MPLTETEIKTRLGLILQGVLAEAIRQAGYTAIQDYQYDPACERPDFLIPDHTKPRYMIEVHQTEARNSFQMKTLRAFTAVTEAKAHYGERVVSVNVLFGDPDRELPASNVRALCGIFDVNLVPRKDAFDKASIAHLEAAATAAAADEDYTKRTRAAIDDVTRAHPKAVKTLADLVIKTLSSASARVELFPIWKAERERVSKLAPAPRARAPTYYKRGLLGGLFLSDADFAELIARKDPEKCSVAVRTQLVATGLASVTEEIDGDRYSLDPQFARFIADNKAPALRELCREDLARLEALKWFFEDIRDGARRRGMVRSFLAVARGGRRKVAVALLDSLRNGSALGIEHSRCWIADLIPLVVDKSHNFFNRRIYTHPDYNIPLGNPYNNMAIRAPRLGNDGAVLAKLSRLACDLFFELVDSDGIDLSRLNEEALAAKFLNFRLDAAIKLRKLDPLVLVAADVASAYGLDIGVEKIASAISDLADEAGVGAFRVPVLSHEASGRRILMNVVAVHDQNGDHKSKEWGARRQATLYRYQSGKVSRSAYNDGLFILDGEWEDKDVARLYRSGWNHICRLSDLETTLMHIFGLKGKAKEKKRPNPSVVFESGDDAG
jgi:hypothetical protein